MRILTRRPLNAPANVVAGDTITVDYYGQRMITKNITGTYVFDSVVTFEDEDAEGFRVLGTALVETPRGKIVKAPKGLI